MFSPDVIKKNDSAKTEFKQRGKTEFGHGSKTKFKEVIKVSSTFIEGLHPYNDDYLILILPNDYSFGPDTLLLLGSDVDSTWVKTISIGNHNLEWAYFDELMGSITAIEQKVFVEKNTTTDIEILY